MNEEKQNQQQQHKKNTNKQKKPHKNPTNQSTYRQFYTLNSLSLTRTCSDPLLGAE